MKLLILKYQKILKIEKIIGCRSVVFYQQNTLYFALNTNNKTKVSAHYSLLYGEDKIYICTFFIGFTFLLQKGDIMI
jgi:hypothetical protein